MQKPQIGQRVTVDVFGLRSVTGLGWDADALPGTIVDVVPEAVIVKLESWSNPGCEITVGRTRLTLCS